MTQPTYKRMPSAPAGEMQPKYNKSKQGVEARDAFCDETVKSAYAIINIGKQHLFCALTMQFERGGDLLCACSD
jgi:hypothetical protein